MKSSKEVSSSKSKPVTKKPTIKERNQKETQESKAANKKSTSTNSFSHGESTLKQSFQKITLQKTSKNQTIDLISKTEKQLLNLTVPSENITAPVTFSDASKSPIAFNINIVVNDEILKG